MKDLAFQHLVEPSAAGLAAASVALCHWLAAHGAPEAGLGRVELVLEEVVMNIIMHGTPAAGAVPRIRLAATALAGGCRLAVSDNGPPFNPAAAVPRTDGATLDQAAPGGLGLVLLRRYAQDLDYRRLPAGNRLALTVPYAATPGATAG